MIDLTGKRECFFDGTLVNDARTTAEFLLHHPIRKNVVITHDKPWEGNSCDYHNILEDDGLYRMYYLGFEPFGHPVVVCYAESKDGIRWEKPVLNICEFDGSTENNIILDKAHAGADLDNFMVFKDENPACPPEKKYKGILSLDRDGKHGLHCMYSADGIHFEYGDVLTTEGAFDTLNVVFWDKHAEIYRCYYRGYHAPGSTGFDGGCEDTIRDIRYMESLDFVTWTGARLLDFDDEEEYALYTNVVQKYPRADHIFVGFPTRYYNRKKWTANYDELGGKEKRLERMKRGEDRFGLVLTDCMFMTSRDGFRFHKYNEAFMRPGAENALNWVYGDGYPARGLIETPSDLADEGADNEYSMYIPEGHWVCDAAKLVRYTVRLDGFVSMHAGVKEKMLVTKPFTFTGTNLYINFSTSALGYMYFTLVDTDGNHYTSCETFGDKVDRRVCFEDGVVEKLSGKPVTLEVRMKDADLYSFIFR